MTHIHGGILLRHIRKLVAAQCPNQQSDLQLLEQFIAERDEAAFAALVQRHGGMVLGVCRGVLRHQQDAEDVFQAAFLVLARKAGAIRKQQALSSWLHGVAYRLALKARRRQGREQPLTEPCPAVPADELTVRELRVVVHEELHRLPEKYRTPLLLCYWEGKTRDESAERLGISANVFKKRLESARNLLGSRLTRRGLAPSAAFFAALLSADGVRAAIAHSLIQSTAQAAVAFAAGQGASVGVPAAAVALANGVIRTMNMTKWASVIALLLLIGSAGTGIGLLTYQNLQAQPPDDQPKAGASLVQNNVKQAAQKPDNERIVGVWRVVKAQTEGEKLPIDDIMGLIRVVVAKDGKVTMTIADKTEKGGYEIVAPGQIDLKASGTKQTVLAIYQFDGDNRLTICADGDRTERPKKINADKGTGNFLFSLVRAKPSEEKLTAEELAQAKEPLDKVREAAARAQCTNNLKQIGIALHNYHDQHGSLPAHAIYSKDGKTPLLSWRVAILPYIDQNELYKEFKLDEPWDSPTNKELMVKMPKIYGAEGLGEKKKGGLTYWQVVTGPDTVFDGAKKMRFTDITDGTSNTILIMEAKDPVIWTKPADLVLPKEKDKKLPVGGLFKNGFLMGMCDASVHMMAPDPAPALLRALITPCGGEQP
jgi:RNA polymerase sigma factor (sigma-70 family)